MAGTTREMLISHDFDETRVAVLEHGELVEYYLERAKRSVVGNVYLDKGPAVRKRMVRELVAQLGESLHVPVVEADDLAKELLFGPKQWLRLLGAGAIAACVLWAVFTHQHEVLTFLIRDGISNRILAASALTLFVPLFAFVYGTFAQYLLRLFKFD